MRTAGAVVADGERMRDMKGNMRGNRLGAQNAHGAKREGAQYAARGRGSRRQARGSKRRYGNSGEEGVDMYDVEWQYTAGPRDGR
jgi:hypothetical protein